MAGFFGDDLSSRSKALQFMQSYQNPNAGDVFWPVGGENKRPGDFASQQEAISAVSIGDELLKKMLEQMFLSSNAPKAASAESQYYDIASNDYRPDEKKYQRWTRRAGVK